MTAGSVVAPFIIPIRAPLTGKAKHEIDTNTPIEIKSDTPNVSIFYTLDGTKPDVPQRPGLRGNSTLKYTGPIRLLSGKVSVRAVAVTSDGRQSAVVTKVFMVEVVPSELQDGNSEQDQNGFDSVKVHDDGTTGDFQTGGVRPTRKGPRFLTQCLQSAPTVPFKKNTQIEADAGETLQNLKSTQISRIKRETDFLRCYRCLSPRPSDPFARFCLRCGAPVLPVPTQRLPVTEGGQLILCVRCKTLVPANTSSCVVCEAPITPQLQPQASLKLQVCKSEIWCFSTKGDKVICLSCGTGNPAHITYCVTCEATLQKTDTPVFSGQRAPPVPSTISKPVSCSKCSRVNHSDARFCDWCGAKPGHAVKSLTCSQCGASSHPYADYCGTCGVFLEGPPRVPSSTTYLEPPEGAEESAQSPSAGTVRAPRRTDAQTQTVGLFYPSGAELQKQSQHKEAELSRLGRMSDRKPLLTAISPGRGFWRKQLDHICAHLRSYTQNNSEFRALVGEPRMGRLVSAMIEEDSYEVSLRLNFLLASSDRSRESKDSLLLKELGQDGRGQISLVQQLLDEGADPSCLDSDGRTALATAVVNGHHDVIPVLVQKGADVDQQSGPLKNTALHEAVALGAQGLQSAEILLGCNASLRRLNNQGQTPYDLAQATGCSSMITLLASGCSQNPRTTSGLDTFS